MADLCGGGSVIGLQLGQSGGAGWSARVCRMQISDSWDCGFSEHMGKQMEDVVYRGGTCRERISRLERGS